MNNQRTRFKIFLRVLALLLSCNTYALAQTGTTPAKKQEPGANSSGWAQERIDAEKLICIKESCGSVFLAVKIIANAENTKPARELLRKSANTLSLTKITRAGQSMRMEIGLLGSDFAFLQSLESEAIKQKSKEQQNVFLDQHLKDVSGDYDILLAAAQKQLGESDAQVKSLKQLQAAFRQSSKNSEKLAKMRALRDHVK